MGDRIFHMGPLGSAAVIKVITNMLAFIHLEADGEALMLAKRGGLDLKTAWEAIAASSGTSFVHETEGKLILNGSYDIAFTNDLALKDLGFALGFGREFGVPLDLAAMTEQTFVAAKAAYGGRGAIDADREAAGRRAGHRPAGGRVSGAAGVGGPKGIREQRSVLTDLSRDKSVRACLPSGRRVAAPAQAVADGLAAPAPAESPLPARLRASATARATLHWRVARSGRAHLTDVPFLSRH